MLSFKTTRWFIDTSQKARLVTWKHRHELVLSWSWGPQDLCPFALRLIKVYGPVLHFTQTELHLIKSFNCHQLKPMRLFMTHFGHQLTWAQSHYWNMIPLQMFHSITQQSHHAIIPYSGIYWLAFGTIIVEWSPYIRLSIFVSSIFSSSIISLSERYWSPWFSSMYLGP